MVRSAAKPRVSNHEAHGPPHPSRRTHSRPPLDEGGEMGPPACPANAPTPSVSPPAARRKGARRGCSASLPADRAGKGPRAGALRGTKQESLRLATGTQTDRLLGLSEVEAHNTSMTTPVAKKTQPQ